MVFDGIWTPKPIIIACEACANKTSDSVTLPTPLWTISTPTSSLLIFSILCIKASIEPSESALIMIFKLLISPSLIWADILSNDVFWTIWRSISRLILWRSLAIFFKSDSFSTSAKISPAWGTWSKPRIWTGSDGLASVILSLFSFIIARTFPGWLLQINGVPMLKVPFWIKTVATGPNPLSNLESITIPLQSISWFAFRSNTSASSKIASIKSSIPSPVWADVCTDWILPPQSSTKTSFSDNSLLTMSGLAPCLSILLIATTIGTSAAFAWLIASIVWGITLSSAATTRITISVDWAPLALIAVKASCPGVSKKVILLSLCKTW